MNKSKNMSKTTRILLISQGNPKATEILIKFLDEDLKHRFLQAMLILDHYNITGERVVKLWNDSCNKDIHNLNRTIYFLGKAIFTQEEIDTNLSLPVSVPFVQDDLGIENINMPSYEFEFTTAHPKWKEFSELQKHIFIKNLVHELNKNKEFTF